MVTDLVLVLYTGHLSWSLIHLLTSNFMSYSLTFLSIPQSMQCTTNLLNLLTLASGWLNGTSA